MNTKIDTFSINWSCKNSWKKASQNTLWCLFGCSIGDFGTIAFFQYFQIPWSTFSIMTFAVINGLLTSIILETLVLTKQMSIRHAFKTAIGMSFISMVSMEITMNAVDFLLTGGAKLTWWVIPIMLFVGYVTPLPYNYWRLKALGKNCH
tara:strand:+ start:212 stop:658 length:447 start_codon:yes stop_codon:yes gene_type:complete